LASTCFFWGTTYLGIRVALESFSPAVLVAVRFLLSGSIMTVGVWWLGYRFPRGRDLWWSAALGLLILGGGTSCLVYSETLIPSSLAALIITLSPFWYSGLEALIPGGEKLRLPVLAGVALGFAGVALLIVPDLLETGVSGAVWQGFLILQLGSFCWCFGSIMQRRRIKGDGHPFAIGGIQQLAAGVLFIVPALLEKGQMADFSAKGVGALLYLVFFGSIVGFSSYVYTLTKLPVAMVSIYTYVNPLVAAVLGLVVYQEPFGWREIAAMVIIFCGVWVVQRHSRR
jgi:drug/metabolite transporter (DMT)-like permease